MFAVVSGGSGSGKSAFAEALTMACEPGEKIYIATMEPYDEEGKRRVKRHRRMREGKHFRTVECFRHLDRVVVKASDTVLLECMSNLVAGEMFHPEGRGDGTAQAVLMDVRRLADSCRNLVVVTNDVFGDGIEYAEGLQRYLEVLGEINQGLGREAEQVFQVVCCIPVRVKG
ncbi:MAG: bifunctional adenosylcobinamide kinase/adenosylcobinamide-phosphate guanylyltransferase [Lachnospiraceae bacterium]|nr:bifunctional adenosylcobinamide kinase/adenosylcobinamide-phosphate guanylyltransferase [Lachnospiraceae bacterium]